MLMFFCMCIKRKKASSGLNMKVNIFVHNNEWMGICVYVIMCVTEIKREKEVHACCMHPFLLYSQRDVSLFNKLEASINTKSLWSADYQPDMIFHKHLLTYTCAHTSHMHRYADRHKHFILLKRWHEFQFCLAEKIEYTQYVNIKPWTGSYLCGCEDKKSLPYVWSHRSHIFSFHKISKEG